MFENALSKYRAPFFKLIAAFPCFLFSRGIYVLILFLGSISNAFRLRIWGIYSEAVLYSQPTYTVLTTRFMKTIQYAGTAHFHSCIIGLKSPITARLSRRFGARYLITVGYVENIGVLLNVESDISSIS